jgi:GntR family transcriptional regulator
MLISIRPTDPNPIYRQIMDEIRRAIALDLLLTDEPLPSVRQLSAELRINPNTVQQAYRELERDGVVYVRRGRGTFVADVGSRADERRALLLEVARRTLRESYRHGFTVDELIEAMRQVAETEKEPS